VRSHGGFELDAFAAADLLDLLDRVLLEIVETKHACAQVGCIDVELAHAKFEAIADMRKEEGHVLENGFEAGQRAGGIFQHPHRARCSVVQQSHVVAPAVLDQPSALAREDLFAAAGAEQCASCRSIIIDGAVAFEQRAENHARVVHERQCPQRRAFVSAEDSQPVARKYTPPRSRAQPLVQRLRCA